MNCEWNNMKNHPRTAYVVFFENRTVETEFSVFEFWGQFTVKTDIWHMIWFYTPLLSDVDDND